MTMRRTAAGSRCGRRPSWPRRWRRSTPTASRCTSTRSATPACVRRWTPSSTRATATARETAARSSRTPRSSTPTTCRASPSSPSSPTSSPCGPSSTRCRPRSRCPGSDRSAASWQYPMASLLATGAVLSMGSDWPVSSHRPLEGLGVAVTRADVDRRPARRLAAGAAAAAGGRALGLHARRRVPGVRGPSLGHRGPGQARRPGVAGRRPVRRGPGRPARHRGAGHLAGRDPVVRCPMRDDQVGSGSGAVGDGLVPARYRLGRSRVAISWSKASTATESLVRTRPLCQDRRETRL